MHEHVHSDSCAHGKPADFVSAEVGEVVPASPELLSNLKEIKRKAKNKAKSRRQKLAKVKGPLKTEAFTPRRTAKRSAKRIVHRAEVKVKAEEQTKAKLNTPSTEA